MKKKPSIAEFFSHDIPEANELLLLMIDDGMSKLIHFLMGIYSLYSYSLRVNLPFTSSIIMIPGYLILGALFYSILYSYFISQSNERLFSVTKTSKSLIGKLNTHTNFMDNNAEEIELLKGNLHETNIFMTYCAKAQNKQLC